MDDKTYSDAPTVYSGHPISHPSQGDDVVDFGACLPRSIMVYDLKDTFWATRHPAMRHRYNYGGRHFHSDDVVDNGPEFDF